MGGMLADGGGILVPGDTPIGFPEPGIEVPANPCQVVVRLIAVLYGGDFIGSQWQFDISINFSNWASRKVELNFGRWHNFNAKISDGTAEEGCGVSQLLTIRVRARERNGFILDSFGERFDTALLPCTPEGSSTRLLITVPVKEYFSGLYGGILRKNRKVALLSFLFQLEARCVSPG